MTKTLIYGIILRSATYGSSTQGDSVRYKATAYDNRNGGLKPLETVIETHGERDPVKIRIKALAALYNKMDSERKTVELVGFQMWQMGGITWHLITDEPLFRTDPTMEEWFILEPHR